MRSVVEIGASVPAFLGKLWKLVNDPETDHLISWSSGGKAFCIKNQAEFARELLPIYYKHNNMTSLIRQLNMYGFHKITPVDSGGLRYEKDEIEFTHPCFVKGHSYLLEHIKRKIANPKSIVASNENGEKILLKPELMNKVLSDVKQMKGKQETLDAKFSAMKQENEALWREVAILRQKHIKQQQIVNNLIQFLMSLVQSPRSSSGNNSGVGVKRPYQLMINNAAHKFLANHAHLERGKKIKLEKEAGKLQDIHEDNMEDGPTIHELAHDDVLHSEVLNDDINTQPNVEISCSPYDVHANNTAEQEEYQVTLEVGDDIDSNCIKLYPVDQFNLDPQPIITSPSPILAEQVPSDSIATTVNVPTTSTIKGSNISTGINIDTNPSPDQRFLSSNSFNIIPTTADLKLPAEIFASDDSIADATIVDVNEELLPEVLRESLISFDTHPTIPTQDSMVGGLNIKLEDCTENSVTCKKSNKNKVKNQMASLSFNPQDIKSEHQEEMDINNMTLATLNNNSNVDKMSTMFRRDFYNANDDISSHYGKNKNDIDDHLDTMQTDIDSLRELLRGDSYTLDTNTLLGLFGNDDPFYGLSFNIDDRSKSSNSGADASNQIISYTGNLPDFNDISMPNLESDNSQDDCLSPGLLENSSTLNTPKVVLKPPAYTQTP